MGVLFYLTSGLFLGWSLGANDASNVFGTAVGSRMIRFVTAAWICSVFIVIGAVIGGAGAAHGLGKLGAVNALAGSFTVALSAAMTVFWMTKAGLPVSTTQAIVGAIVAWNFFSGSLTDWTQLVKIFGTWIVCPLLGAIFAAVLYKLTVTVISVTKPHILRQDWYTRWGLIVAGAFGSYALGANNIANVMGVFVDSSPFTTVSLGGWLTISGTQQLFLLGSLAIAVGVFTYSKRVMMTVGTGLMPLNPVGAWVVVVAHSLVLFVFSSTELQEFLIRRGLPPIPLIPVSSSQAVIGSVIGIALVQARGKGLRQVNWWKVLNVAGGWVATPIGGAIVCYILLFFVQNVFQETVFKEVRYLLSEPVVERLTGAGIETDNLDALKDQELANALDFRRALRKLDDFSSEDESFIIASAELFPTSVDAEAIKELDQTYLTSDQINAIENLTGQSFDHKWQLAEALSAESESWQKKADTPLSEAANKQLDEELSYVMRAFHRPPSETDS